MALVGMDGYEHGVSTTGLWTSGNLYSNYFVAAGSAPTVTAAAARSGGYGLRFGSDAARSTTWLLHAGTSTQIIVASFYMRPNTASVADIPFMFEFDSGARYVYVRTTAAGKVFLECNGISSSGDSSNSIAANTWSRVDIRITTTASPWTIDWQLDGTAQTTFSPAEGTTTRVLTSMGPRSSSASIQQDFDDIVWSTTSGDYPLGQYRVLPLAPNASGAHNLDASPSSFFFGFSGAGVALETGETALYGYMDDAPLNGSSDYLYITGAPGSGQYAEIQFESTFESGDAAAVNLLESVRQGTAGGSTYTSKIYDGTSEGTARSALDPNTTTEEVYRSVFVTAPSGGAWTSTKVNAATARFGYTTDASPEIRVYAARLEAAYAGAAVAPAYVRTRKRSRGGSW